jgi:hypothetical protein
MRHAARVLIFECISLLIVAVLRKRSSLVVRRRSSFAVDESLFRGRGSFVDEES